MKRPEMYRKLEKIFPDSDFCLHRRWQKRQASIVPENQLVAFGFRDNCRQYYGIR